MRVFVFSDRRWVVFIGQQIMSAPLRHVLMPIAFSEENSSVTHSLSCLFVFCTDYLFGAALYIHSVLVRCATVAGFSVHGIGKHCMETCCAVMVKHDNALWS